MYVALALTIIGYNLIPDAIIEGNSQIVIKGESLNKLTVLPQMVLFLVHVQVSAVQLSLPRQHFPPPTRNHNSMDDCNMYS